MKNNFKIKKIALGVSLFIMGSVSVVSNVEAQWSVIDVNSNAVKTILEKGITSLKNALEGIAKNQETQVKQVDQYQEDTDKRNRLAYGLQDTLRRDRDAVPTIEQCIEITDRAGNNNNAFIAANGGGGSGKRSDNQSKENAQSKIITTATAQSSILQNVLDSKTCTGAGMDLGIPGCNTKGDFAGADVNYDSLTKNYTSRDPNPASKNNAMTNSLSPDAMKAAIAYSRNATLYAAPPELSTEEAKKNPAYIALYKSVILKLNAATSTLEGIAALRKAPDQLSQGISGKKWKQDEDDYLFTFGVKPPPVPSFFEVLNFAVMRDYVGPVQEEETKDPIKLAQELNQKMVLSNVIALQQYQATEKTNIMLAHLLTQAVTPANIENVKAEAARTKNMN